MGNEVDILDINIDKFDNNSINNEINRIIKQFSDNKVIINKMVFDSIVLLTEAEIAEEKLTTKGALKRLVGVISGSNRKLADQIRGNRGKVLYLAQQMLQKIAEEQLLTLDIIANIDNRLNFHIKDLNSKINNIYKDLRLLLSTYKEGLIAISEKVEKHNRDIALLTWLSTLGYQEFNGIKYKDLDELSKIVCIIKDFYFLTDGNWSQSDLLMIRVALDNLNIPFDLKFNYLEALLKIYSGFESNNIFFINKEHNLSEELSDSFIILKVFEKLAALDSNDTYLLDICKKINNNNLSDFELRRDIIKSYIIYNQYIDIDNTIDVYNFILDFLYNLHYSHSLNILDDKRGNKNLNNEGKIIDQDEETIKLERENYALKVYKEGVEALNNGLNDKAYELFSESVDAGNREAIFELAKCYYYGYGTSKNIIKAIEILEKGIETKNYNCYYLLASIYEIGEGIKKNIDLAKEYYKNIIELSFDNPIIGKSELSLAKIMWSESDIDDDKDDIIKLYICAFIHGQKESMYELGINYYYGINVAKNIDKAVNYIELSSLTGFVDAKYLLCLIYLKDKKSYDLLNRDSWLSMATTTNNLYVLVLFISMHYHYAVSKGDMYNELEEIWELLASKGDLSAIKFKETLEEGRIIFEI